MANQRKLSHQAMVLTFRREVSLEEAREAICRLQNALRQRKHREGWEYSIELHASNTDPRTGKRERLHIHVLLKV